MSYPNRLLFHVAEAQHLIEWSERTVLDSLLSSPSNAIQRIKYRRWSLRKASGSNSNNILVWQTLQPCQSRKSASKHVGTYKVHAEMLSYHFTLHYLDSVTSSEHIANHLLGQVFSANLCIPNFDPCRARSMSSAPPGCLLIT